MLSRKTLRKVVRGLAWLGVFSIAVHLLLILWAIAFINLSFRHTEDYPPPLPTFVTDSYPPAWFPDGDRIAFSHAGSIYVVDSSGWGLQLIHGSGKEPTRDDLIGLSYGPSVSPDGSRIAYAAYERYGWWLGLGRSEGWEIVTTRPDGSDQRRLTKNKIRNVRPVWSSDGTRIFFRNIRVLYAVAGDGSDKSVKVVEVEKGAIGRDFALSPDGSQIAFVAGDRHGRGAFVVNTDGSNVGRLADNADNAGVLAWSPDGQRIAYTKTEKRNTGRYVAVGIYTVGIDGSDVREIISFPDGEVGWIENISWSPDGSEILFGTTVIAADGSAVRELPYIPDGQASWSPDGSRIAVYNEVWPSGDVLYTVARDGTDARVLCRAEWGRKPVCR